MEIRQFNLDTDYEMICTWWKKHEWACLPKDLLPKTGYVVDNYAAGFLYKTDSKWAVIENIISNPDTNVEERSNALDKVLQALINEAKDSGYTTIFTTTVSDKLKNRYIKNGFITTDKNVTHLIRSL